MPRKVPVNQDGLDSGLKMTFEEALHELEQIISKLEIGDLSLELALELHERGQQLAEYCSSQLENAELKIKKLNPAMMEDN